MNVLKGIKKIGTGLLLLFLSLLAISPIASFLNIPQPPIQNIIAFIQFLLIIGTIVIIIALLSIFGFGYLALTGWRNYKKISKGIRFWFSFLIGVAIFSISGPISALLPIPFLPIALTAILFWGILRTISTLLIDEANDFDIPITQAIVNANELVKKIDPNPQNFELISSEGDKKSWRILFCSKNSQKQYEIQVDKQNGGIMKWRSA
jgi:hypothetical protein